MGPAIILIQIAIPSLLLLYILDEYIDFWSISNNSQIEFDAYMIPSNEMDSIIFRLLDVDNRTVPSLGVKADAIPGRLNQIKFIRQRPGIFFGQCSEICGANHRFIPIVIEIININYFLN